MIEDKDYIMRLTHEVVRTLIRLLFQKDIDKDEEAGVSAEMAVRYRELLAMIKDGQVNEAENLETVRLAAQYLGRGVDAIDLAGAEGIEIGRAHV